MVTLGSIDAYFQDAVRGPDDVDEIRRGGRVEARSDHWWVGVVREG